MGDTIEKSDLMLDELARLALTLAREMHQRAMECEDAAEARSLTQAFHVASRSARQCVALQQRLDRARALGLREERAAVRERHEARKAGVRLAVRGLAWTEKPDWTDAALNARLVPLLETEDEALFHGPIGVHIARIAEALGIASSAWRHLQPFVPANAGAEAERPPLRRRAESAALNTS